MAEDVVQRVGERIDSFSLDVFKTEVEELLEKGSRVLTLDLLGTQFLSISCIKLIASWADRLQAKGGKLVLLSPSEKIKRQIGIYGCLEYLTVKKSMSAPEERPTFGLPVHDETLDF